MKRLILVCEKVDSAELKRLCMALTAYFSRDGRPALKVSVADAACLAESKSLLQRAVDGNAITVGSEEGVLLAAESVSLLWIAAQQLLKDGLLPDGVAEGETVIPLTRCRAKHWVLPIPAYTAGEIKPRLYNCGAGKCEDDEPSVMQVVTDTTETAFLYYVEQLKQMGYAVVFENGIDGNRYVNFFDVLGNNFYAYYMCEMGASVGVTRVIWDRNSTPLSQFCYHVEGKGSSKLYYFHHVCYGGHIALIHCADNSWIFIDGENVAPDSPIDPDGKYADEIYGFMREHSGLQEGERVVISCWCVSHLDCDHFRGFWSLIKKHHDGIELQRTMFNAPSREVAHHQCWMTEFKSCMDLVNSYYPDLMHLKTHPGQEVQIANIHFTVLHSQDAVGEFWTDKRETFCEVWNGWWPLYRVDKKNPTNLYYRSNAKKYDFNNSSTVYRIDIEGLSLLEMGDAFRADAWVVPYYALKTLTTDAVVLAHHFFNDELHPFYWSLIRQERQWYALVTAPDYPFAGEKLDMVNACDPAKNQYLFTAKYEATQVLSKVDGMVVMEEIPAPSDSPRAPR